MAAAVSSQKEPIATPTRISRNNNPSPDDKKEEIALKPRPTFRKSMTPVSVFGLL